MSIGYLTFIKYSPTHSRWINDVLLLFRNFSNWIGCRGWTGAKGTNSREIFHRTYCIWFVGQFERHSKLPSPVIPQQNFVNKTTSWSVLYKDDVAILNNGYQYEIHLKIIMWKPMQFGIFKKRWKFLEVLYKPQDLCSGDGKLNNEELHNEENTIKFVGCRKYCKLLSSSAPRGWTRYMDAVAIKQRAAQTKTNFLLQ